MPNGQRLKSQTLTCLAPLDERLGSYLLRGGTPVRRWAAIARPSGPTRHPSAGRSRRTRPLTGRAPTPNTRASARCVRQSTTPSRADGSSRDTYDLCDECATPLVLVWKRPGIAYSYGYKLRVHRAAVGLSPAVRPALNARAPSRGMPPPRRRAIPGATPRAADTHPQHARGCVRRATPLRRIDRSRDSRRLLARLLFEARPSKKLRAYSFKQAARTSTRNATGAAWRRGHRGGTPKRLPLPPCFARPASRTKPIKSGGVRATRSDLARRAFCSGHFQKAPHVERYIPQRFLPRFRQACDSAMHSNSASLSRAVQAGGACGFKAIVRGNRRCRRDRLALC